jgi:uncharacterized protein YjdB
MQASSIPQLLVCLALCACVGPKEQTATPQLDLLQVLPFSNRVEVGDTVQLGAQRVRGPDAENVTASAVWQSDNEAVVTVSYNEDDGALVKAVAPGTAHIMAQAEGASSMALFVVEAPVTALELDNSVIEVAVGSTLPLGAVLIAQDGKKRAFDKGAWGSSDPAVASVDARGTISALSEGLTEITLVRGGLTTSQLLQVRSSALQSLRAEAVKASVLELGQTTALRVIGTLTNGREQDLSTLFTWSVPASDAESEAEEEAAIASVSGATLTALKPGAALVQGTGRAETLVAGQTVEVPVTVVDSSTLSALRFDIPPELSLQRGEVPLALVGTFAGQEITGPNVTITAEPANIVFVDKRKGVITPLAVGTVMLTASADPNATKDDVTDDISALTMVTVTDAPLTSLVVQPSAADATKPLVVSGAITLRALAIFGAALGDDASSLVLWTSADPKIAAVSNVAPGIVTGRAAGSTNISASYLGQTASLPVTVTATAAAP